MSSRHSQGTREGQWTRTDFWKWLGACPLLLLFLASGCAAPSRPVSIPIWQESVEDYVWLEANGDPAALRDLTWRGDEKGFSIIGTAVPEKSTDANGILLAHRTIEGRTWFIFLVGLVDEQEVEDIRLAALTFEEGEAQWHLSQRNPQALQAYRQYRKSAWRQLAVDAEEPPPGYLSFPRPDDRYDLSIDGRQVQVKHQQSGAIWQVNLASGRTAT